MKHLNAKQKKLKPMPSKKFKPKEPKLKQTFEPFIGAIYFRMPTINFPW